MNPIKAKSLLPKVAELTGYTLDQVTKTVDFYYKTLRSQLTEMDDPRVMIEKVGVFFVKERTMRKKEMQYTSMLKHVEVKPEGIRKEAIIRNLKEKLEKIWKNLEKLQQQRQKRQFVFLHKKQYKDDKVKGSLAEQAENTSGDI